MGDLTKVASDVSPLVGIVGPLLAAVVGGVVGGVSAHFLAWQKFKIDLQAKYDESLRDTRIRTYQNLWGRLRVLAKYAAPEPVTPDRLLKLAIELREWYFDVGGLFFSDNSRDRYFDLQDAIVDELAKNQAGDVELSSGSFEIIRAKSSALRTSLSSDIRSRNAPRV